MDRRSPLPRWVWVVLGLALTVWGLTDVRNRGRVDPDDPLVHKSDLTCYTEAGAAMFDGRNPYDVANPRGWRYLYPPLLAILLAPLAALDPQWQAVIWFAVSVGLCYGCFVEGRRLLKLLGERHVRNAESAETRQRRWLGWLVAGAILLPTLNCLQRGQVGILLGYLLLLGVRLVVENRSTSAVVAGGYALALAIAIKLTPLLPTGVLLLGLGAAYVRSGRTTAAARQLFTASGGVAVGLLLFLVILPGAIIGPADNWRHLGVWFDRVVVHKDMGADNNAGFLSVRNQSLSNAVYRLGNWAAWEFAGGPEDQPAEGVPSAMVGRMPMDDRRVGQALLVVKGLLVVALLAAVWRTARGADPLDLAALFGLGCVLSLIVSPLSWAHHYLVALPGLVAAPAWQLRAGRPKLAIGLAASFCVLMAAHYLLLDWAGRLGVLGLGTTGWFVIGTVGMLVSPTHAAASKAPINHDHGPVDQLAAA